MEKKKGFTLVELLVVIAIIALLMGILMPALAKVRQVAYRMVSGTNQSGIGKAMLIYANDNEGDYPVSGSRMPKAAYSLNRIANWEATNREDAYGYTVATIGTKATPVTIGSCFYLLVKFADVAPKQFVNKSDIGCKEFQLGDYTHGANIDDITEVWDFGSNTAGEGPQSHVSYSYHYPYYNAQGNFPVTQQSNPSCPVISDRNPYLDRNATHIDEPADIIPNPEWKSGVFVDNAGKANAACHQLDGQNVLFNDMHVRFEKLSNCGIDNDNIFLSWKDLLAASNDANTKTKQMGTWPSVPKYTTLTGAERAWSEKDAFLVSDPTRVN
ncbi:MAG TPA: type II secretion system protein [Sedimentisphaerales bacterium]|nr:type II secretion system protein [Sedimentisphaerales bacterium]